jgi:hypothetical protein
MTDVSIEDEFDQDDLHVNFSSEEASSEGRSFDPVPRGQYHVAVTEVELKRSKSEKNPGKPFWALTCKIQNGPYAGQNLWANVMLFDGALYSLAQLAKAIGREVEIIEQGKVPPGDELLGEEFVVVVSKQLDTYKRDKAIEAGEENPVPEYKNEVKGFKPLAGSGASTQSGDGSSANLMP